MNLIYRWFIGDMGTPGEYQYQLMHIIVCICLLVCTIIVFFIGSSKKISDNRKDLIGKIMAWFFIGFEIFWRFIYLFVKKDAVKWLWPMYPCNLGGVLIPIISLVNKKTLKEIFYLFGIVGGLLTFALPEGIFSTSVFVFPIMKSVFQHVGLILIPVYEYSRNKYRPNIRSFGFVVIGCLIHLFNAEVIDRIFGFDGDYMFIRSGMPFVIPGVPQFITFSVFGLVVFFILCYLCDIKKSNEIVKNLFLKND